VEDEVMERNESFGDAGTGGPGSTGGYSAAGGAGGSTGGYGAAGGGYGTTGGSTTGGGTTTGGASGGTTSGAGGGTQGTSGTTGTGTGRSKGAAFREKASDFKANIADKLEAGAEALRQRAQGSQGQQQGQYAGATGGNGETGVAVSDRFAGVAGGLASGMQSTADWLREADLDNLRDGIETQVKEHPGRTLLIALGLGYVLGKAFRK
jgi:hypothetical protein